MSVSRKHELLRANQSYSTKSFFISCPLPWVHSILQSVFLYSKLVRNVGEKCHLASSLDCYGKLSLVKSAVAGNTSGEDLRSLGNELSELCGILVIDIVHLILAEDANLLSSVLGVERRTLIIVSFH